MLQAGCVRQIFEIYLQLCCELLSGSAVRRDKIRHLGRLKIVQFLKRLNSKTVFLFLLRQIYLISWVCFLSEQWIQVRQQVKVDTRTQQLASVLSIEPQARTAHYLLEFSTKWNII